MNLLTNDHWRLVIGALQRCPPPSQTDVQILIKKMKKFILSFQNICPPPPRKKKIVNSLPPNRTAYVVAHATDYKCHNSQTPKPP